MCSEVRSNLEESADKPPYKYDQIGPIEPEETDEIIDDVEFALWRDIFEHTVLPTTREDLFATAPFLHDLRHTDRWIDYLPSPRHRLLSDDAPLESQRFPAFWCAGALQDQIARAVRLNRYPHSGDVKPWTPKDVIDYYDWYRTGEPDFSLAHVNAATKRRILYYFHSMDKPNARRNYIELLQAFRVIDDALRL